MISTHKNDSVYLMRDLLVELEKGEQSAREHDWISADEVEAELNWHEVYRED